MRDSPLARRPVGDTHGGPVSPLFHYPYSRTRAALETLSLVDGEWDACNGFKLMFTNPTNGLSPIRSMGAFMQMFPAGFKGTSFRETGRKLVCCVAEGSLRVQVGDQTWTACKDDVFVVPGWAWRCFEVDEQCVLFSFSDRPLQEHPVFGAAKSIRAQLLHQEKIMKICLFNDNRLGLIEGDIVYDVSQALRILSPALYPFPRHDLLIANLAELRPEIRLPREAQRSSS